MSDRQTTTPTTLTAVVARCRAALVSPIRRPYVTILTLGIVFMPVGAIASFVTGGIAEAVHTVALGGVVWFAALLWAGDHRPSATDHRRPTHADENGENRTHSTTTTTEED